MLQAAAKNIIDFSTLNLREKKSRNKVKWMLSYIYRNNIAELQKLQLVKQCAVLDYNTARETLETHWENASTLYAAIQQFQLPWLEEVKKTAEVDPSQELEEAYKRAFPDADTSD